VSPTAIINLELRIMNYELQCVAYGDYQFRIKKAAL
jgi:hypothetical protein